MRFVLIGLSALAMLGLGGSSLALADVRPNHELLAYSTAHYYSQLVDDEHTAGSEEADESTDSDNQNTEADSTTDDSTTDDSSADDSSADDQSGADYE